MLHTLTLTPDAETQTKLAQLMHGDVVAKPNGTYRRVVLRDANSVITLGFPKRMTRDVDAHIADYVSGGKVLVVGRVTEREATPKASKRPVRQSRKHAKPADSTNDALDKRIAARRGSKSQSTTTTEPKAPAKAKPVTKAAAADVLDAMAATLTTLAAALR